MFEKFKKYLGKPRPCLICNDDPEATQRATWATDEYFKAVKCQRCGMVTIEPGLSEEGLTVFYSQYMKMRTDNEEKMKLRDLQYKQDLKFITNFIDSGKILDVGCNGGFFLNAFSNNFEKFGIEIDPGAVEYAKENFDLDVRFEKFGDDSFDKENFDLVIFRGVIEHMFDPKSALDRAWEVLKPGGKLFFAATPNIDCISADLYRDKWRVWHPIEHINFFSVQTLHDLIGKDRFSLLASEYPYLGTPYENQSKDYQKLQQDISFKENGRWDEVSVSPPFWGNMMNVVYSKKIVERHN